MSSLMWDHPPSLRPPFSMSSWVQLSHLSASSASPLLFHCGVFGHIWGRLDIVDNEEPECISEEEESFQKTCLGDTTWPWAEPAHRTTGHRALRCRRRVLEASSPSACVVSLCRILQRRSPGAPEDRASPQLPADQVL